MGFGEAYDEKGEEEGEGSVFGGSMVESEEGEEQEDNEDWKARRDYQEEEDEEDEEVGVFIHTLHTFFYTVLDTLNNP